MTTTIQIEDRTWKWLNRLKKQGESFQEVLDRLKRLVVKSKGKKEVLDIDDFTKILTEFDKVKVKVIETLEKEIKKFGNTGHITLPKKYVGRKAKVLIDTGKILKNLTSEGGNLQMVTEQKQEEIKNETS